MSTRTRERREVPALVRKLWRRGLRARHRLYVRRIVERVHIEHVDGVPLLVLPDVISPRYLRAGEIFARALDASMIPPRSRVLDLGTGSGVIGLFAARWAERVTLVDINPSAVRCAKINVMLNWLDDRVEVLEGDLFEPVAERRFDVILFNPPFFRGPPKSALDQGFRSMDIPERFAGALNAHLTETGHALMILSTDGDESIFVGPLREAGFEVRAAYQRDLVNEVLTIYRVQRAR